MSFPFLLFDIQQLVLCSSFTTSVESVVYTEVLDFIPYIDNLAPSLFVSFHRYHHMHLYVFTLALNNIMLLHETVQKTLWKLLCYYFVRFLCLAYILYHRVNTVALVTYQSFKEIQKNRLLLAQPCALHGHFSCPMLCIHSHTFGISYFTLARSISFNFSYRKDISGTQFLRFFPLRMFLYRLFYQIYNDNLSYIFSFNIKVFQNYLLFLVRSQSLLISFISPVSNRHFPPDFSF